VGASGGLRIDRRYERGRGLRSEYELLVGLSSRFISLKLFQSTFQEYNGKGTDYLQVFGSEYEFR
jgi:hypothetical protein